MSALVATVHGERRYHRWAARALNTPDTRETRAAMLEALALDADQADAAAVRAVLGEPGRIPLAVLDHVVRHTALTIIGPDIDGLAGRSWAPHPEAEEPRRPLTLVDRRDHPPGPWWRRRRRWPGLPALLAHEAGHAWLEANVAAVPIATRANRSTLWSAARSFGPEAIRRLVDREYRDALADERRACQLSELWGYAQLHESAWCSRLRRELAAEANSVHGTELAGWR